MPIRTLSTSLPSVQFEQGGNEGISGLGNAMASLINLGPQLAKIESERKQQELDNAMRDKQLGFEAQRVGFDGRRVSQEGERIALANKQHAEEAKRAAEIAAENRRQFQANKDREASLHGVSPTPMLLQGPPNAAGELPTASVDDLLAQKMTTDAARKREDDTKIAADANASRERIAEMAKERTLGAAQIRADAMAGKWANVSQADHDRRYQMALNTAKAKMAGNILSVTDPEGFSAAFDKAVNAAYDDISSREGAVPAAGAAPAVGDKKAAAAQMLADELKRLGVQPTGVMP
jgi:hypothetical protein